MPKPSSDNDDAMDSEMFDFLSEDAANRPARKQIDVDSELPLPPRKTKPLPTIRKPVPVSQSGPNVRPGFSAPVSGNSPVARHEDRTSPSQQTGSQSIDDDFDFLDETVATPHQAAPASQSRPMPVDSYDQFDENWNEGVHDYYDDDDEPRPRKWPLFAAIGIGVIALASYVAMQSGLLDSKTIDNLVGGADEASAVAIPAPVNSPGESIADQFRRELARIEALVANGELALATSEIDALDPRVLGYGNPEFTALRAQIAAGGTGTSSTESADAERLREAQRLAEEAVIAEEKRLAEEARRLAELEAARVAEETRLAEAQAAEEARRAEQARLAEAQAAEEARRVEQARQAEAQAAEDARRAEQARLAEAQAAEEARRAEQARQAEAQAAEDARRAEQARQAEEQAAEEARRAEQARLAEAQAAEEARRAEAERLAEQSAAREDQLQAEAERLERERLEAIAAEQRAEARRAAAARAAQAAQASSQVASASPSVDADREATNRLTANASAGQGSSASSNNQNDQSSVQSYTISDADFNSAYKRFIAVKTAIEGRDINLITQLADTDGARVQALLQLFSNSESVKASIDNVSTRNSAGMIVGNLTITRVVRRGGGTVSPPANLRSFTLTTRRDAAGWSKIKW